MAKFHFLSAALVAICFLFSFVSSSSIPTINTELVRERAEDTSNGVQAPTLMQKLHKRLYFWHDGKSTANSDPSINLGGYGSINYTGGIPHSLGDIKGGTSFDANMTAINGALSGALYCKLVNPFKHDRDAECLNNGTSTAGIATAPPETGEFNCSYSLNMSMDGIAKNNTCTASGVNNSKTTKNGMSSAGSTTQTTLVNTIGAAMLVALLTWGVGM
jgi:hypothetical protein